MTVQPTVVTSLQNVTVKVIVENKGKLNSDEVFKIYYCCCEDYYGKSYVTEVVVDDLALDILFLWQ